MYKILCTVGLLSSITTIAFADSSHYVLSDAYVSIDLPSLERELGFLPYEKQQQIRRDREELDQFLEGLYLDLRIEQDVIASGLAQQPDVQARLQAVKRQTLVNLYIHDYLKNVKTSLPDFEPLAQEYYKTHPEEFTLPAAVRVRHLLFQVDLEDPDSPSPDEVKDVAQVALQELQSGAPFSEVSQSLEEHYNFVNHQEIRKWIGRGDTVPPFEKAAFDLTKPNDISGLVRSRYGYHIIQLIERRNETLRPFEQVSGGIIIKLRDNFVAQKRQELIERYYPETKLKPNETLLKNWMTQTTDQTR